MTNTRREPRKRTRTTGNLSLGLVTLLLLVSAMGVSQAHVNVVTGHSVFVNADGYDQCLASVAGIVRMRIMWFNDQILVERYNGDGNYIYATEHGAPDPRNKTLVYSGTTYDFVDPNGARWIVEEAYWDHQVNWGALGSVSPYNPTGAGAAAGSATIRYYTWIVEVGKPVKDNYIGQLPNGGQGYYNFVDIVDTCKMHNNTMTYAGTVQHNQSDPNDPNYQDSGHPLNETRDHSHESYMVDLWVGRKPTLHPVGCIENPNGQCQEPPNEVWGNVNWASQWNNDPGSNGQDDNARVSDGSGT